MLLVSKLATVEPLKRCANFARINGRLLGNSTIATIHRAVNVMHPLLLLILSSIICGLIPITFSGSRYGEPPWMQERPVLIFSFLLGTAIVCGLMLIRSNPLAAERLLPKILRGVLVSATVCLPVVVLMQLTDMSIPKATLLLLVSLVFVLLILHSVFVSRFHAILLSLVILGFGAQYTISPEAKASLEKMFSQRANSAQQLPASDDYVISSLHDIAYRKHLVVANLANNASRPGAHNGGAFKKLDESRLLLVDANGNFYELNVDDSSIQSKKVASLQSPMNRQDYERDLDRPSRYFRVTDMLLMEGSSKNLRNIFIAHHYWNEESSCVTLNLSEAELDVDNLGTALHWKTRFRTAPCIPGDITIFNETGGRIALSAPDKLLLTVGITIGDLDRFADEKEISYGKIIEIDTLNWSSRDYSTGHRNPQGLLVNETGIFSTEHGPDGGDELNLVIEGADYGWPSSSYGVDYGKKSLSTGDFPGRHTHGTKPIYSWVPSIGVSRLIKVKGNAFSGWQGDYLVGSLGGRGNGFSLYRVRINQSAVKFAERIRVGTRIRDLIELDNGNIMSWDGEQYVYSYKPALHVFSKCKGCHAMNRGWPQNGVGPDLFGMIGKQVATVGDYHYSDSLKALGGRWSKERLDWFLSDPEHAIPGTKMSIPGISDAEERQAIINYIEKVGR